MKRAFSVFLIVLMALSIVGGAFAMAPGDVLEGDIIVEQPSFLMSLMSFLGSLFETQALVTVGTFSNVPDAATCFAKKSSVGASYCQYKSTTKTCVCYKDTAATTTTTTKPTTTTTTTTAPTTTTTDKCSGYPLLFNGIKYGTCSSKDNVYDNAPCCNPVDGYKAICKVPKTSSNCPKMGCPCVVTPTSVAPVTTPTPVVTSLKKCYFVSNYCTTWTELKSCSTGSYETVEECKKNLPCTTNVDCGSQEICFEKKCLLKCSMAEGQQLFAFLPKDYFRYNYDGCPAGYYSPGPKITSGNYIDTTTGDCWANYKCYANCGSIGGKCSTLSPGSGWVSGTRMDCGSFQKCWTPSGVAPSTSSTGPDKTCGDGKCGSGETKVNCPDDCAGIPAVTGDATVATGDGATVDLSACGNGDCDPGETSVTCPDDCRVGCFGFAGSECDLDGSKGICYDPGLGYNARCMPFCPEDKALSGSQYFSIVTFEDRTFSSDTACPKGLYPVSLGGKGNYMQYDDNTKECWALYECKTTKTTVCEEDDDCKGKITQCTDYECSNNVCLCTACIVGLEPSANGASCVEAPFVPKENCEDYNDPNFWEQFNTKLGTIGKATTWILGFKGEVTMDPSCSSDERCFVGTVGVEAVKTCLTSEVSDSIPETELKDSTTASFVRSACFFNEQCKKGDFTNVRCINEDKLEEDFGVDVPESLGDKYTYWIRLKESVDAGVCVGYEVPKYCDWPAGCFKVGTTQIPVLGAAIVGVLVLFMFTRKPSGGL